MLKNLPGVKCAGMLLLLIFSVQMLMAQTNIKIVGKISDSKDAPVVGASVLIKGTTNGATTDESGNFAIDVPNAQTVLVISSVGFTSQEITVGSRTTINVKLVNTTGDLDNVVVVGYATQRKVTVTGAVSMVKGSDLQKSPTVNLSNALAGRLPGVTTIQASGEPGYDGSTIRIRGTNTLGNSAALIVIDGIPDRPGGLERLNPSDIESMSVLKDASAAIYGARAANGVILITTKRGKSGKPMLMYDYNQAWSQPTRIPKMANNLQYAEMANELVLFKDIPANQWAAAWPSFVSTGSYKRTNDNVVINAQYKPDDFQKFRDGSDPWGHPSTDWYDATLKTWSPQSRHNIQVSGGTDAIKYLGSVGYSNQDGYYKNSATGYKQYDLRLNLDAKINQYVNMAIGIVGREERRFFPTRGAGAIFRMQMRGKPTEQAIWPNGLPGPDIENGENPVVITTGETGYDKDTRDYIQTTGKVEFQIPGVKGLKLTGMAAVDKYNLRGKRWETPWELYFWDKVSYEADGKTPKLQKRVRSTFTDPRLNQRNEQSLNINLTGLLNYDVAIKDHSISFLAGVTRETIDFESDNQFRRYFLSENLDQMFAGGQAEQTLTGSGYERARLSYFGRVGYNFREKYLAEFVWRYDGSYIFPESDRFGFFPGVLVGWNISEEPFFKNNVPFVNALKVRGSYGQMGNDQVFINGALAEYAYLGLYSFNTYILDNSVQRTLQEGLVPNPFFTWERANNLNVGLEGSLFQSKLSFEFEYFYNKRDQILIANNALVPASSGIAYQLPPVNLGKLNNKGWEFKVGYQDQKGDFRYGISANAGKYKNEIVFWSENPAVPVYQRSTGKSFGTSGANFLLYEYDGVFIDQKEIDANKLDYSAATGSLKPGDMKFKDVNGDGKINADDRVRNDKNRDPTLSGGLSLNLGWKDFDLSILFQGAAGGMLFINTESGDIGNYLEYTYNNRWTVDNPSSVDPRIANRGGTYYTGGGFGDNTYWYRSSDYIRLKNVEIGYNLPANLSKKVGISNLRVYLNGLNLVTWDEMKLWDPESTNSSGQYYPQARIISFGARVTL